MAAYVALKLDLPAASAERASALLHDAGAMGVEVRDHEHPVPPGVTAPEPGRAIVVGYFDEAADTASLEGTLRASLEGPVRGPDPIRFAVERCQDEDWAETWKAHFVPLHVAGRLWVLPPWVPPPDGEPCVVIEPGMAFGTGAHATTALCLEALARTVPGRRPSVVDLGCGTGILGIAAARLGAGRVVMVDNDPVAVEIARQNALENGCPSIEVATTAIEELGERFDLVVANILAVTLIELARPVIRLVKPGGELLLSGILTSQAAEVEAAYRALGLGRCTVETSGEWALLRLG